MDSNGSLPQIPAPRRPPPSEGPTVVWFLGELDIATEAAMSEVLARLTATGSANLVLDLSGVTFVDASTLGAFVRSDNDLRMLSRSLSLQSPSALVRRLLDICGLQRLAAPRPVVSNRPPANGSYSFAREQLMVTA